MEASPVYQPNKARLSEGFQQLEFLRRFIGCQVQLPDFVPDLFVAFLLHPEHVRHRPQARSNATCTEHAFNDKIIIISVVVIHCV